MTTAPYEEVEKVKDPFQREALTKAMAEYAVSVDFRGFQKMLIAHRNSLKQAQNTIYIDNVTQFTDQPLELDAGDWNCDDFGVTRGNGAFEEMACCHPIMPVERLVNVDTGVEKLKIAYSKGRKWRDIIVDKKTLASTNAITSLADMGIAVNSENAKYLILYLHDVENRNYDAIPETKCVSRLGWIDDEGFSPYVDGLTFDGSVNFGPFFKSVRSVGSQDKWLEIAIAARKYSTLAKIVLAASFASVLVHPLGCLPFFVHLWGGSGAGKTVGGMLAASVWADPEKGRYWFSFDATKVGQEKTAAFFNSLPLIMDDFQLERAGGNKKTFDGIIYSLAEGVGRVRGTKSGGIEKVPTWSNCIITNGETPITSAGSGGGAVNRVIEIECTKALFEDPHLVAKTVRKNFGFAGREFVSHLDKVALEEAYEMFQTHYKAFMESNSTDKQAMAAACIVVADALATRWIFQDDNALTATELAKYLQSKSAVSVGDRGYQYMCDWVTKNANKLRDGIEQGDVYGVIDGDWVYVISTVFRQAAEDAGFSSAALLSWLKEHGLIQTRAKRNTKGRRINGVLTECVVMMLPSLEESEQNDFFLENYEEII